MFSPEQFNDRNQSCAHTITESTAMMHLRRLLLLVGIVGLLAPILEAAEVQNNVIVHTQVLTTPINFSAVAVSSSEIDLC